MSLNSFSHSSTRLTGEDKEWDEFLSFFLFLFHARQWPWDEREGKVLKVLLSVSRSRKRHGRVFIFVVGHGQGDDCHAVSPRHGRTTDKNSIQWSLSHPLSQSLLDVEERDWSPSSFSFVPGDQDHWRRLHESICRLFLLHDPQVNTLWPRRKRRPSTGMRFQDRQGHDYSPWTLQPKKEQGK